MLIDRPKEEIARDLMAQVTSAWGEERAEALRGQIENTAGWISLIARHRLELDGDEPDYLVAPVVRWEGE